MGLITAIHKQQRDLQLMSLTWLAGPERRMVAVSDSPFLSPLLAQWLTSDGPCSLREAQLRLLGQQLLLALLSDVSNSGQSLKLVSAVLRVPAEGSSSNLLWHSLKCPVFPLALARALNFLVCMLAFSYWGSGGNFKYLFSREKFLLFSSALLCLGWVVALAKHLSCPARRQICYLCLTSIFQGIGKKKKARITNGLNTLSRTKPHIWRAMSMFIVPHYIFRGDKPLEKVTFTSDS